MRLAVFVLALLVGGGVAQAQQVVITSASPHRIVVAASCWTAGSNCQLAASDLAQGYCHGIFEDGPRLALYVRSEPVERSFGQERVIFVFRCDRRSIICQAGSCN